MTDVMTTGTWDVTSPGWRESVPHVALVGHSHSGKSSIAAELAREGWIRLAIADPIKDATVAALNAFLATMGEYSDRVDRLGEHRSFSRAELNASKETFRPLIQQLGTEFARNYLGNQDVWLWMLQDRMDRVAGSGRPIVVDDVRLLREADVLADEGFHLIRLIRPETDPAPHEDAHLTVTEIDQIACDTIIVNDDTIITAVDLLKQYLHRVGAST